ncbi:hypothetical protein K501DRAFT_288848 [Backusella circina FSU 941]|nr:hypothetical protein K501DRAFT_288848 [Backusella circina FSU 941]
MAEHIFSRFIAKDSQFEINVDERVRQNIQKELSYSIIADAYIFDEAKTIVYIFLEASFERFIHSCVFEDMAIHCGEHATHYNKSTIQTAVDYLLNSQKQHEQDDLSFLNSKIQVDNQFLLINKHHCTLVKSYIQEFVESMFGSEYLEKDSTKYSAASKSSSFSSSSSSTSNSSSSPKQFFLEKLKLIK